MFSSYNKNNKNLQFIDGGADIIIKYINEDEIYDLI
jgi:hypothetical protein